MENKITLRCANLIGITLAALLCSCSVKSKTENHFIVWRASEANGDKPGIGYELIEDGDKTAGSFFILEPSHPHDFDLGMRVPMTINKLSATEYRAFIPNREGKSDEIEIKFCKTLDASIKVAVIKRVGDFSPQEYTFHRSK